MHFVGFSIVVKDNVGSTDNNCALSYPESVTGLVMAVELRMIIPVFVLEVPRNLSSVAQVTVSF
jgi:hypothetical protein